MDNSSNLTVALEYLDAIDIGDGLHAYRDDATRAWWTVDIWDLRLLGDMLSAPRDEDDESDGDVYSRWCSGTSAERQADDWTPERALISIGADVAGVIERADGVRLEYEIYGHETEPYRYSVTLAELADLGRRIVAAGGRDSCERCEEIFGVWHSERDALYLVSDGHDRADYEFRACSHRAALAAYLHGYVADLDATGVVMVASQDGTRKYKVEFQIGDEHIVLREIS